VLDEVRGDEARLGRDGIGDAEVGAPGGEVPQVGLWYARHVFSAREAAA
jgi:hypothetical protein